MSNRTERRPLVEIATDGQQTVCPDVKPPEVTDKASFLKAIRESGLVGMGGASFPTHVKLAPKQKVDTLAINAAECEPYITSDYRQMVEAPDEVLDGVLQVMRWLEIPKAVIGIEQTSPRPSASSPKRLPPIRRFGWRHCPPPTPRAQKRCSSIIRCRIVGEGQLPADQGVIVMNVSSVAFVSRYLKTGMPLVERMLTVDGDVIGNPCNVVVPMGTPVRDVLAFAQCDLERAKKLLYGGPMMGICIPDVADPILKANNAILAFEKILDTKPSACIHCGRCLEHVPCGSCPRRSPSIPPEGFGGAGRTQGHALHELRLLHLCLSGKASGGRDQPARQELYMNSIKK